MEQQMKFLNGTVDVILSASPFPKIQARFTDIRLYFKGTAVY